MTASILTSANLIIITSIAMVLFWFSLQWRFAGALNESPKAKRIHVGLAFFVAAALPMVLLAAGHSGIFKNFSKLPPPHLFFLIGIIGLGFYLAFSKFGTTIIQSVSLENLVLFHSFRFLTELSIHLGVREGIAPVQMSLHGYNFDIATAILSVVCWFVLRKLSSKALAKKLAFGFNVFGLAILTSIMLIAVTSMPAPFRLFHNEPSNIWVTGNPYIFLPGILVLAALTGHLLIFRKLKSL